MDIFRKFRASEDGSATVEFVVVFSFLAVIVFAFFEIGWLMTRQMMLDRGVDVAVRDIRLGKPNSADHDVLKSKVCKYASILKDCERDLVLEVVRLDAAPANFPKNQPNCRDRAPGALDPTISVASADDSVMMFMRACMIIDPIFPGMGIGLQLPKDNTDGFQMVSYTAFKVEPN